MNQLYIFLDCAWYVFYDFVNEIIDIINSSAFLIHLYILQFVGIW